MLKKTDTEAAVTPRVKGEVDKFGQVGIAQEAQTEALIESVRTILKVEMGVIVVGA